MAHRVSFPEALNEFEGLAKKLGATAIVLEQNQSELRHKQAELRDWTRLKRSDFFLQSIRRERKMIISDGLKLQAEKARLEVELEKARSDVNILLSGGRITRL